MMARWAQGMNKHLMTSQYVIGHHTQPQACLEQLRVPITPACFWKIREKRRSVSVKHTWTLGEQVKLHTECELSSGSNLQS